MKVLCVGTLLLDVITEPLAKMPSPERGIQTAIDIHPGGNAFNVAADLVKLGVPSQDVYCLGALGDDAAPARQLWPKMDVCDARLGT